MLVDPQFLEQLKVDRDYKQIQKPADSMVKTNLSLDIGKTLNEDTLSDRSTGMAPVEVDDTNEHLVRARLYP